MKVTDLFPLKQAADQEERTRRNLLPVRIVEQRGSVTNARHLLRDNPLAVHNTLSPSENVEREYLNAMEDILSASGCTKTRLFITE